MGAEVTMSERAVRILRRIASGKDVSRVEGVALAREWIEVIGGGDALAVIDGDRFSVRRLIDLCEKIVRSGA